jgi:hypothetical protein
MGDLSDAMQNLVDGILSSVESRRVYISEMTSDTHNLLERFRLEHQDMTNALNEKFSSDRAAREEAAQQRREATQQFISDTRSDIQDMANALRQKLSSDREARMEAGRQRREATQQFISDTRSAIQDTASAVREKLDQNKEARKEFAQRFMDEVVSDHAEAQRIWRTKNGGTEKEPVTREKPVERTAPEPVVEEQNQAEEGGSEPSPEYGMGSGSFLWSGCWR